MARALHSETATTNTIEGGYINHGGQFVLGESGPSNFLLIRNEGWLENTDGIIGYEPGADSNLAWVTGINSLWDNRGRLRVGVLGVNNRLVITNGGRVNLYEGVLGDEETSRGNSVLVTGIGSRWSSRTLQVGYRGFSNEFLVVGGALASSSGQYDAVGYNEPSYGNRMEVSGPGSTFTGYNLAVGSFLSDRNELRIVNGGQVWTTSGYVGNGASNTVLISGAGSAWYNHAVFFHGNDGSANRLVITNEGRIFSVGATISGSNNTITIAGTNTLWETGGPEGQFDLGFSFYEIPVSNQVSIVNGGRLNSWNGYVVGDFSRAHVSGPGSLWQNVETLTVGEEFGIGNELTLSNRARINTGDLTLAADFGRLNVRGLGTVLDVGGLLSIGDELGRGNEFFIRDGGQVSNGDGYVGGTASAFLFGENTANRALISDVGSSWINRSNLTVGVTGSETELAIRNGGRVSNRTSYLGYYGYSRHNRVIVSDAGSVWDNIGQVYVGYAGSSNTMIITNQGSVQSGSGWVGRNSSDTNSVLVSGINSSWIINGGLLVGNGASANRVTVSAGGRISSTTGAIDSPNGRSNSVLVTGPASTWKVDNLLNIGGSSSLNHLRIENDGLVVAGAVALGSTGNSISNTITVSNGGLIVTNSARTATFTLNEGALFLTGTDLLIDRLQASSGAQSLISFQSGIANIRTLSLSGNNRIGDGVSSARLQLGPTTHTLGSLVVAPGSTLVLAGTATGAITNAGLLEVGTNVAGANLTGSLVQTPSGSIAFDLGGTVQRTGYDFIQVDGVATFNGILRLRLVNGFVPASNNVFILLSASAHNGSFVNAPNGARVTFEGTSVSCQVEYAAGVLRLLNFQNAAPASEIDEAWAIRYFGHSPLTEAEKAADPDGDQASNYQEYVAGTHPLDGTSVMRILSIRRNQFGQALIDFTSTTNRAYGVALSNDLETWTDINSPSFTPISAGVLQWLDNNPQTGEPRFYRIAVR